MSAPDRDTFERLVAEALSRLYDEPFLQSHPLGALLLGPAAAFPARLRGQLLEAIESLKPASPTSPESPLWRRYQYVRRRYVDSTSLDQIADELGIGDRQARRYNREGIEAVAASLWTQYSERRLADEQRPALQPDADPGGLALVSELVSVASTDGSGPTSLPETLERALTTVAGLLDSQGISLDVALASGLPPIVGHRVVLRQVLLGLFTYLVEQRPRTRARVTAISRGATVEVEITAGQPASRRAASERSVLAASPAPPQPGARLDYIRRLVEFLRGTIEAQDEGASSLRLLLRLPAAQLATILLIDDNLDFRRLFQRFLEDSAYRVDYAEMTDDLVGVAVERRPDVIILDVMMPTRDGWEVLQALKREGATRDIPVIVCSVLREPTLAAALGAAGVLVKPITRADLLSALERHCPPPAPVAGPGRTSNTPSPRRS